MNHPAKATTPAPTKKERIERVILAICLLFIMTWTFGSILRGDADIFGNPGVRFVTCLCFLGCGGIYWFIKQKLPQFALGLFEIAAGLWSNYYQLGKISLKAAEYDVTDRVLFIAAGVAVIGHGFKELFEGLPKPETAEPAKK